MVILDSPNCYIIGSSLFGDYASSVTSYEKSCGYALSLTNVSRVLIAQIAQRFYFASGL